MGATRTWNDDDFVRLAASSRSWNELGVGLGMVSGHARWLEPHALRLGVDVSHFTGGQAHGRGGPEVAPLEALLVKGARRNGPRLKRRLIDAGLLAEECSNPECAVETTWLGEPLVLQLEHRDGDPTNNLLSNLCLLCPNCHSQTATWGRRKRPA